MPTSELSLRVYFMERFHSKFVFQKCVFFTNIENGFSSKMKKNYDSNKHILSFFKQNKNSKCNS